MSDATSRTDAWLKTFAPEVFAQKEPERQLPAHMVPTGFSLNNFIVDVCQGVYTSVTRDDLYSPLDNINGGGLWNLLSASRKPVKADFGHRERLSSLCRVVQPTNNFLTLQYLHENLVKESFLPHENPVFVLVKTWMEHGTKPLELENRENLIASDEFTFARDGTLNHACYEPGPDAGRDAENYTDLFIPGYEPVRTGAGPIEHLILPSTPKASREDGLFPARQKGNGARLDMRLFLFLLAGVPRDAKRAGGRFSMTVKVRDLVAMLWPEGDGDNPSRSNWRPSYNSQSLQTALWAIPRCGVELPFAPEHGQRGELWIPVTLRQMPKVDDLESKAIFDIEFPRMSGNGARINFSAWQTCGALSDAAFFGWLAISMLWDQWKLKNNGKRIYATRPVVLRDNDGFLKRANGDPVKVNGRKTTNWSAPGAVRTGKLEPHPARRFAPWLTKDDVRRLCYGKRSDTDERTAKSKKAKRAVEVVKDWQDRDWVTIDPRTTRGQQEFRIIENYKPEGTT